MLARSSIPLVLLGALAGAFALSQSAFSASAEEPPLASAAPASSAVQPTQASREAGRPVGARRPASAPRPARLHETVRLRRDVAFSERPGGPLTAKLRATTEFGSARVLGVAARRGDWLGVVTTERPNGRLAWVRSSGRELDRGRTRWSLHADLSARTLTLRRGRRTVQRLSVAIGASGSETPTGRFAVTDKLSGARFGPYYGCCILALSGHQPNTPPGWQGGNRLAIHGTDTAGTIGQAASAGCLRAGDDDLRALMSKVPLGTPVFIRG